MNGRRTGFLAAIATLLMSSPLRAQDAPRPAVSPAAPPTTGRAPASPAPAPAPAAPAEDRKDLRAGDSLSVAVLDHPELGAEVRILADGTIDVPFVGRVSVLGRTIGEISKDISDGLKNKVRDPQVAVTVQALAPNEFYVLGEVGKAGAFTVARERRISLLQAFGMAGGFAGEADFTRVSIVPASGAEPRLVDATPGRSTQTVAQIVIQNGDTIVVPAVGRIYVMGQVNRTGGFVPPAGERLTLTRAIALAGGFTRLADEGSVLVTWKDRGESAASARFNVKRILQGGLEDPAVFPGNLIVVGERIW
jgi:polysaccharide export outer membrane protein